MNRFLMSAAVLAIAVPATAQVQTPQAPVVPIAPQTEAGHTRDQAVAKVREHFAKMDANRDGFVAGDEMQSMRGKKQGMKRQMGDRMADRGRVGRDPSKAFDRIDANRDGMISRDEFAKGRELRIERKMVMKGTPGAPGMDGAHGGMMKMADLDKDGRVSLQEATTSALQHFDMADTNRDGRITPDERRSMHQKMMQMRAPKAG